MRTIKFRGKGVYTGEWVYGDLIQGNDGICIILPIEQDDLTKGRKVIPESVGQFTGLKDKNGVEIYEGDIVLNVSHHKSDTGYEVKWQNAKYIGISKEGDEYGPYTLNLYLNDKNPKLEVIGNIHDKTPNNE